MVWSLSLHPYGAVVNHSMNQGMSCAGGTHRTTESNVCPCTGHPTVAPCVGTLSGLLSTVSGGRGPSLGACSAHRLHLALRDPLWVLYQGPAERESTEGPVHVSNRRHSRLHTRTHTTA